MQMAVALATGWLVLLRANGIGSMPQTVKIDNIEDALLEKLAHRAARHGRSVEAEHLAILKEALNAEPPFDEIASKLRALLHGRQHTPSELLMREGREER